MASFGSFETERELASTPKATTFLARQRGPAAPAGTAAAHVVKVYPPASATDTGALSFGETSFLRAPSARSGTGSETTHPAATHTRLAALSEHLLPVVDQGTDDAGQWFATPFCPLSASRLITGKVTLPADTLYRLFASIIRALADLKARAGRTHGNLKSTNILLTSADVREAQVLLSDPAPDGPAVEVHEQADLRALGLLLYQLVFRREITDDADWLVVPVEMSREWTAQFGPAARGWLELCNRLLDRRGSLQTFHLGSVVDALPALAPKPAVSRRTLVLAAAVILVLGAAGGFFAWQQRFATLHVTSDPPGAILKLDGADVGRAGAPGQPWKLRVRKGDYQLVASVSGLDEVKRELHLTNQTASVHLPFEFASLELQTVPPGASVEVESGEGGTTRALLLPDGGPAITPCRLPFLPPGPLRLRFVRPEHETFPVETNLAVRQSLSLRVELKKRIPGQVEVKFQLTPEDVSIVDEGGGMTNDVKRTGAIRYLSPGSYQLVATYPGWPRRIKKPFDVTAGMGSTNFEFKFPNTKVTFVRSPEDTKIVAETAEKTNDISRSYEHFPTGPIRFIFTRLGYKTNEIRRELKDREPIIVGEPLEPLGGFFTFRSRLWPVELKEGDQHLGWIRDGESPEFTTVLKEGRHTVTASYGTNFLEASVSVDSKNGQMETNQFDFNFGVGQLASDPPGAEFYWRRGEARIPLAETSVFPAGTNVVIEAELLLPTIATNRLPRLANSFPVTKEGTNLFPFKFEFASVFLTTLPTNGPKVFQGEKFITNTPCRLDNLPLGRIEFRLSYSNQNNIPVIFDLKTHREVVAKVVNCELPSRYTNRLNMVYLLAPDGFYVGEFEVRQREFTNVVVELTDERRRDLDENANMPMTKVGWRDAEEFCRRLNADETEKKLLAQAFPTGFRFKYDLPSETDWTAVAPTNADCLAQSVLKFKQVPDPVNTGRASSNSFGVFDLIGNVKEWCKGRNDSYLAMGGSCLNTPSRKWITPSLRDSDKEKALRTVFANSETFTKGAGDLGFRCFLKPEPVQP